MRIYAPRHEMPTYGINFSCFQMIQKGVRAPDEEVKAKSARHRVEEDSTDCWWTAVTDVAFFFLEFKEEGSTWI